MGGFSLGLTDFKKPRLIRVKYSIYEMNSPSPQEGLEFNRPSRRLDRDVSPGAKYVF